MKYIATLVCFVGGEKSHTWFSIQELSSTPMRTGAGMRVMSLLSPMSGWDIRPLGCGFCRSRELMILWGPVLSSWELLGVDLLVEACVLQLLTRTLHLPLLVMLIRREWRDETCSHPLSIAAAAQHNPTSCVGGGNTQLSLFCNTTNSEWKNKEAILRDRGKQKLSIQCCLNYICTTYGTTATAG